MGDVGNVGILFIGNSHVADWEAFPVECLQAWVVEKLLGSTARRILEVVLQVQEERAVVGSIKS